MMHTMIAHLATVATMLFCDSDCTAQYSQCVHEKATQVNIHSTKVDQDCVSWARNAGKRLHISRRQRRLPPLPYLMLNNEKYGTSVILAIPQNGRPFGRSQVNLARSILCGSKECEDGLGRNGPQDGHYWIEEKKGKFIPHSLDRIGSEP